jgi:hypothetical protein
MNKEIIKYLILKAFSIYNTKFKNDIQIIENAAYVISVDNDINSIIGLKFHNHLAGQWQYVLKEQIKIAGWHYYIFSDELAKDRKEKIDNILQ